MVWCAVSFHRVNGPYVFKDTVNSQWYLLLLKNKFAPGLQKQPAKFNMQYVWFMQDGATSNRK